MVKELGAAIAEAQFAMDQTSLAIATRLGTEVVEVAGRKCSLLELGFTPTFYQLTEATIETKVSFSVTRSTELGVSASATAGYVFFAASVSASYSQKYSYTATGSSSISARFVSVPAPTILTDAIRAASGKV
jgi:hypothetical protein